MSDCLHDLDFTQDAFLVVLVFYRVLVDDLDGDFLVGGDVEGLLHFAKGTLSQGLAQPVFSNDFGQGVLKLLGLGDTDFIS